MDNMLSEFRGTGRNCSRCCRPLSGAKFGMVGLHIQTRSPPSQQELRPSSSPTPPRQNPRISLPQRPRQSNPPQHQTPKPQPR